MVKGVANVWVPVQDIDRALDFYQNTLETHEWGHTFGLGHISEEAHGKLTMSPLIKTWQKSERTLGKGDVLGLDNRYP